MMDVGPGLEATANRLWTTPNRQRSERIRVHGKKERHSQTAFADGIRDCSRHRYLRIAGHTDALIVDAFCGQTSRI